MDILTIERKYGKIIVEGFEAKLEFNEKSNFVKVIKKYFDKKREDVVLDFKDVEYIDSATIGKVLNVFKYIDNYFHKLYIINVNKKIKKVFDLFKLEKVIKYSDDNSLITEKVKINDKIYIIGVNDINKSEIEKLKLSQEIVFLDHNKANIEVLLKN